MRRMVQVAGWVAVVVGALVAPCSCCAKSNPVEPPGAEPVRGRCRGHHLVALHLGRQALAAGLLVWGGVVVSLVAASNGGINSPNLLIYPVLIVLLCLAAGRPLHHGFAGGHRRFVCVFLWADQHGALPAMRPHNRWAYAVYLAGIVGLTAAATLLSRKSYLGGCMRPKPWPKT